ncbi:MAG: hypothetical protein HKN12_10790, partial [Gemmatimonadetes bacterium]|nr:hypothetical protein [Gemmatimonadota bacterium]
SAESRRALAHAIARRPEERFDGVLRSLAASEDPLVVREVAAAMSAAPRRAFLETLREMLAVRDARRDARAALVALGEPAFDYLARSLEDTSLPLRIRRHIPRTISRFDTDRAGPVLLSRLNVDPEGTVRFKILRGLGSLRRRHPNLPLDNAVLDESIEANIRRLLELLDWRLSLLRTAADAPERITPVHTLIVELLEHKETHATERLFRLFSLRYPREDFKKIHRGAISGDPKARASARELLENVLQPPMTDAVLGLLDDIPDAQRLAAGRAYYRAERRSTVEAFRVLLEQDSVALRSLVAHHVVELGDPALRAELGAQCDAAFAAMSAMEQDPDADPGSASSKERAFVVPIR